MSKNTIRLNTQVHLGKTLYAAGKPVPVGKGKDMLSEEEAANLVANFGLFQGDTGIGAPGLDADLAARDARIVELRRERDDARDKLSEAEKSIATLNATVQEGGAAAAELDKAKQAITDLEAEKVQLETDNDVLAKRVKELEDAKK